MTRSTAPRSRSTTLALLLTAAAALPAAASAHDGNLARWDVATDDDTVQVQLRTAGQGLYAACEAQAYCAGIEGQDEATWDAALTLFVGDVVRVAEDNQPLTLASATFTYGHEAVAMLQFSRSPDADSAAPDAAELELDVSRYSDRPGQHHLVFVRVAETTERHMLEPGSSYTLAWTDPGEMTDGATPAGTAATTPGSAATPASSATPASTSTPTTEP